MLRRGDWAKTTHLIDLCGGTAYYFDKIGIYFLPLRAGNMDQRKRMFYVLTCLVGAMTSTASLLAWMAPSMPKAVVSKDTGNILGIARSLVTEDVPVHRAQWHQVEIVPEPVASSTELSLASDSDGGSFHFFIDDRGSLSRAGNWRGQLPAGGSLDTVRVRLARQSVSRVISAQQSRTLSALLRALDEAVSPGHRSLPIHFDPAFASSQLRAAGSLPRSVLLSRVSG